MPSPSSEPLGTTLVEEFEAAVQWWKTAGVDYDFVDDATDWLELPQENTQDSVPAAKPASSKRTEPPPPKKIGGGHSDWPTELAAFQEWWVTSTAIDDGGSYPAIKPRGTAKPGLMIIVAEPEDTDTETLLSGPQGRMATNILRAAGIGADTIYVASVLRRHTPMPEWDVHKASGGADLLLHHIQLVAPNRILSFGRNIPPLLGNDTAQGGAFSYNINHEGRSIPVMGAGSLSELLRSAPRRQRFWHNWLAWTGSNGRNL